MGIHKSIRPQVQGHGEKWVVFRGGNGVDIDGRLHVSEGAGRGRHDDVVGDIDSLIPASVVFESTAACPLLDAGRHFQPWIGAFDSHILRLVAGHISVSAPVGRFVTPQGIGLADRPCGLIFTHD